MNAKENNIYLKVLIFIPKHLIYSDYRFILLNILKYKKASGKLVLISIVTHVLTPQRHCWKAYKQYCSSISWSVHPWRHTKNLSRFFFQVSYFSSTTSFKPKQLTKSEYPLIPFVTDPIVANVKGTEKATIRNSFLSFSSPINLAFSSWTIKIYFITATKKELKVIMKNPFKRMKWMQ